MRVAIVDEGIDRRALLYPERITKTLILHEGITAHDIPEGEHGTACARLLEQCTDNYELFDVRITENWNAPVPVNDLKRALECCIREKINIICLSLGTIYLSEESVLTPVMQEIKEKNLGSGIFKQRGEADTSRSLSGSILRSNGLAGLLKTGRVQNYVP